MITHIFWTILHHLVKIRRIFQNCIKTFESDWSSSKILCQTVEKRNINKKQLIRHFTCFATLFSIGYSVMANQTFKVHNANQPTLSVSMGK